MINTGTCANVIKMIDNTSLLIHRLEMLTDELTINKKHAKEAKIEFDEIFTNSNLAVTLVDGAGTFIKSNNRLEELLGYEKGELLSLTYQDITHNDDLYIDMELAHSLLKKKKAYSMIKRYYKKNGSIIWVLLMVAKVPDLSGNLKYYLAQILDLTPLLPVLNMAAIELARKNGDSTIGIWERYR